MKGAYVRCVRIDRVHSIKRALPLYQASGHVAPSKDTFFTETRAVLRAGFAAAGVAIDELDDMAHLLI